MQRHGTALASIFSFLVSFSAAGVASAQQINVTFGEPDLGMASTSVPSFLYDFYLFAVGIAGVLTVGAIVVGGIMYSVSGAVDKKNEAKGIIIGALFGLLLLLGAYVILRTVNPQLINLELTKLEETGFKRCADIEGLPWCEDNQPERNSDGICVCKTKLGNRCPSSIQRKLFTEQDAPYYMWVKEYEDNPIPEVNKTFEGTEIPDISEEAPGVCPSWVKLEEGTTPYFITSVDKDDGTFVLDLSKQPKFPTLPFPLPPGEYYGKTSLYFITGQPNKALCVIIKIKSSTSTYDIFPYGLKDASLCSGDSSDAENEAELKVKSGFGILGGSCPIGIGLCDSAFLFLNCPSFGTRVLDAGRICMVESAGGNPGALSGSDFCKNEAGKPSSERHPFSMGLFQINVIANGSNITREAGDSSCEGLFTVSPPCGKTCPTKTKGVKGYNCSFIAGKESQWDQCRQFLSKPLRNISLACDLYKTNNKFKPWWSYTVKKCNIDP